MKICVINGPNLNMLGQRQPEIYGAVTLEEIVVATRDRATELGVEIEDFQSNSEGDLVSRIQSCAGDADGIILNAGAYTHTSVALRDAILASGVPCVEVHLSNIHAREDFRSQNFVAPVAVGQICGFGGAGYVLALEALVGHLAKDR
ncbi:MAG: type II 3-dehydroquinate dehydratase [Verrucomicrobia bacterium]|nr:type II 3-dehydroquinate dehydratase [Verrucomicrobiota bacterium]MDA1086084.1 type II 3-dehydroquinate dehydratase [Verrucomicrobiota bacterium]